MNFDYSYTDVCHKYDFSTDVWAQEPYRLTYPILIKPHAMLPNGTLLVVMGNRPNNLLSGDGVTEGHRATGDMDGACGVMVDEDNMFIGAGRERPGNEQI